MMLLSTKELFFSSFLTAPFMDALPRIKNMMTSRMKPEMKKRITRNAIAYPENALVCTGLSRPDRKPPLAETDAMMTADRTNAPKTISILTAFLVRTAFPALMQSPVAGHQQTTTYLRLWVATIYSDSACESHVDIIVIGGGCYGSFQTRRLLKAIDAGRIDAGAKIMVIDRNESPPARAEFAGNDRVTLVKSDWSSYLTGYFLEYEHGSGGHLIPAHIAPHLLFEVCSNFLRARGGYAVEFVPVTTTFGLPFEKESGKTRYISAAAWLCPFSCIEPSVCPAIKAERNWDLSALVPERAGSSADITLVFKTTHFAWGVSSISSDSIFESCSLLLSRVRTSDRDSFTAVIATTSNCHGAVGSMKISSLPGNTR